MGLRIMESVQEMPIEDAVQIVVDKFNAVITSQADKRSTKGKRYCLIPTNNAREIRYVETLGFPNGCVPMGVEETWLDKIINALVEKGHLYKLVQVNGHGYFVQA